MSRNWTKTVGEVCFWIGLVLELIIVIIDKSAYTNPLESQLFRLTFLLFCVKIALTRFSAREWLCILLFGAVMLVSYRMNERDGRIYCGMQRDGHQKGDESCVLDNVCWLCGAYVFVRDRDIRSSLCGS